MVRFVPNHLRTNKIFKKALKELLFGTIYVLDQYKTQEICDNVIRLKK